jgi:glycosyltransferase involved in cell wall biosynthesis
MRVIQPKISIIIPTYNSAQILETCLRSVINQTYKNIELIVVDGKSTDSTLSILEKNKEYINAYISEPDKGIYDAMNKGIDMANGEWLYFMGSDDVLKDGTVIESVFDQVDSSKYDVIYGNVQFKHNGNAYDGEFTSYKLLYKNICHQSMFTTKRLLLNKGKFKTVYKFLADYEFNMNWFNDRKVRRLYLDKIIAVYNENGISFNRTDIDFCNDKHWIIKKYFSLADRLRYKYDHLYKKNLK